MEEATNSALDGRPNLEPPLGLSEHDVGPVQWPRNSIDATPDIDEQRLGREPLDGSLEDVSDLDVVDLEERLLEHRRLEREVDESVQERRANHPGLVRRAGGVGARRSRQRRRVRVRHLRDVDEPLRPTLGDGDDETPVALDANHSDALDHLADLVLLDVVGGEVDDSLLKRETEADLLVGSVRRSVDDPSLDLGSKLDLLETCGR